MFKYKKYDIASKVQYVEEYLKLLETNPKLSITNYAYSKDLADSTFNDWLIKYKKDKEKFINNGLINDEKATTIDLTDTIEPTFIEISKDRLIASSSSFSSSTIKLNYKDISLEFSQNDLEKVMEIIRRW